MAPSAPHKKVAFVTGASSGIGYHSSIELAKRGFKVYAGARRLDSLKPLEEFGITILQLDVTSLESVLAAKRLIASETDHLDVLLNNAGVGAGGPAIEVPEESIKNVFEVNLHAPIRVTREFGDLIINGQGVIAFTSSVTALLPLAFGSIYSASKAALSTYAHTLALEVKPFGVKVVDFITGGIATDIISKSDDHLPADSRYIVDGLDIYAGAAELFKEVPKTDVKVHSARTVKDIEYALSGRDWCFEGNYFRRYRGSTASVTRFMSAYLPTALIGKLIIGMFKLQGPFAKLQKKYSKPKTS